MTPEHEAPDLQTQLESLFHALWEQEKQWQVEDRIDLAVRLAWPAESGQTRNGPGR